MPKRGFLYHRYVNNSEKAENFSMRKCVWHYRNTTPLYWFIRLWNTENNTWKQWCSVYICLHHFIFRVFSILPEKKHTWKLTFSDKRYFFLLLCTEYQLTSSIRRGLFIYVNTFFMINTMWFWLFFNFRNRFALKSHHSTSNYFNEFKQLHSLLLIFFCFVTLYLPLCACFSQTHEMIRNTTCSHEFIKFHQSDTK